MATMLPPQKGVEYITYVNLVSQANTNLFQSNPTLASGDATVTTDGNAVTSLDTTPSVDPASSYFVKVTVSATEMNGDNIAIHFHDVAGDEWCDLGINIQTSGQSFDTTDTAVDGIQTDLSNATDGLGALKALIDTLDTVADAIKSVTDLLPNAGALSDLATILTAIQHATYGLSAIETLVDELESRLTAVRAGYLDELGATNIPADIDTLKTYCDILDHATNGLANLKVLIDAVPTVEEIDTELTAEHDAGSWVGISETAIEFEED